ncbi:hypothetical protein [Clostridium sp. HMP27]|uniref:hypothetical protein n=1 Tax=Clostridium sp. HMP27 TaxID=1487921 RepID=UPI00052C2E84|nr:hypothetical protein [Clostridium sp. HMP27]KGK86550.1 hypothetical protein DP68_13145 [Clostridium sp. HMP27]
MKAINDLLGQKDDFLEVLSSNIETVINEQLLKRLIGKIRIYEEKITVEFKSGIEFQTDE